MKSSSPSQAGNGYGFLVDIIFGTPRPQRCYADDALTSTCC